MKKNYLTIAVFVCLLIATNTFATTYYVSSDGNDANDGTSWSEAFETLGVALGTASSDDEIWVAAGMYKPGTTRSSTFQMVAGVDVYGGFDGTETALTQRDWVGNVTTLSGDIGTIDTYTDNCYHVVTGSVINASLDGFTITEGYADGDAPDCLGGGLFNPIDVYNCIFEDNYASERAGAAWLDGSCDVFNCTFRDNTSGGDGGAIYLYGANVDFKSCLFYDNSADEAGATPLMKPVRRMFMTQILQ